MSEILSQSVSPFAFKPKIISSSNINRKIIDQLPGVHQTETLRKFFGATVDNLYNPGQGISINGYIGEIPSWNNVAQDFYLSEPTPERSFYQLEPTMVSKDASSNSYTNILFYSDLINLLRYQGSIINDHSRLFEQPFYTWCPPIDLDKLLNFGQYYWVPVNPITDSGPDYITISTKSSDKNPWSLSNNWIHVDDLTVSVDSVLQANRPIIELSANLELYNYGTFRRLTVNFIDTTHTDFVGSINRQTSVIIDGITITPTYILSQPNNIIRVLTISDINSQVVNRIYEISTSGGILQLSLSSDGEDPYGIPVQGEIVYVSSGSNIGNEYYFNGINWILAQAKTGINQAPLFMLYDTYGRALNDVGEYPNSNFQGNSLFGYSINSTGVNDPVLLFPLVYDNNGQILFENFISTINYSWINNTVTTPISGYYFHNTITIADSQLSNDWYLSLYSSRQMIVDQFNVVNNQIQFSLSQQPGTQIVNTPNNIQVTLTTPGNDGVTLTTSQILTLNVDYLLSGNNILLPNVQNGDSIEVKTYNINVPPINYSGFYEIPDNLSANPNNLQITTVAKGDVYNQLTQIMKLQVGFTGEVYSSNNWRNTPQQRNLGNYIIQNSCNLLNVMLLGSNTSLDFTDSTRFSEDSYNRFYNQFIQKITNYQNSGEYTDNDIPSVWVNAALSNLSHSKTSNFPFYNSGVAVTTSYPNDQFIPPSPAYLGITPLYIPMLFQDTTTSLLTPMILGHDGSKTVAFGDYRDNVILALETQIYDSVQSTIVNRERPTLDLDLISSARFRNTDYS